jgi:hypothetical protein
MIADMDRAKREIHTYRWHFSLLFELGILLRVKKRGPSRWTEQFDLPNSSQVSHSNCAVRDLRGYGYTSADSRNKIG